MSAISRNELKTILLFGVHIAKVDQKFDVWERKILARIAESLSLSDDEKQTMTREEFSLGKGLASLSSDESQQLLVKTLCAVAHVDGVASGEEIEFIERVIVKLKATVFVYGREEWGKYEKEVFETIDQVSAS